MPRSLLTFSRRQPCAASRLSPVARMWLAMPRPRWASSVRIGSTSPTIGQSYLIDAFLVVVVGGLGQLRGAVIAAFALGVLHSFFEYSTTASVAKVLVFVTIIFFLQVRPQGLFAVKTRSLA